MPYEPAQQKIPQSLEEFKGSEEIVEPPSKEAIVDIPPQQWSITGNNCLVIFPTENKDKVQVFEEKFNDEKPDTIKEYFFLEIKTSDHGCSQPCEGRGYFHVRDRIIQVLDVIPKIHPDYLKEKRIGTIFVAAIESFFQRDGVPRPVDAAVIVMFNVSTGKSVTATSKGVTLNRWFLDEAERIGGLGCHKECLGMTGGEMVARTVPGVDKANWQEPAVGKSRRSILEEAISEMEIPWAR